MYTAFFQGTNPVLELYIDKDICKVEAIEEIIVSIAQGSKQIKRDISSVLINKEKNTVNVLLTEEETKRFSASVVNVQAKFKVEGSNVIHCTHKYPFRVLTSQIREGLGDD